MRGHSYIQPSLAAAVAEGRVDTFAARRASSPEAYGNPYEPNSLISLSEDPLTAYDHRHWPSLAVYKDAVAGRLTPDEILRVAPRVKGNTEPTYGPKRLSVRNGLRTEELLSELRDLEDDAGQVLVGDNGRFADGTLVPA